MEKILIVAKQSKYEYEKEKFGLSDEQIREKYKSEHANLEAILNSHELQLKSRARLKELLPNADMITMDQLKEPVRGYDLVISFGGDNSFTYTSHFVGNTPIMGVNSDPQRSTGALCAWSSQNLDEVTANITNENYKIQEWPRLEAKIDGKPIMPATSEYFFGERMRKDMTRHVLEYRGKKYEQKNSGMIIATGAGSTGWYDSAIKYLLPQGNQFPKTEKKAVFIMSEPYKPKPDEALAGELLPGEQLTLHSLNDGAGYASTDSWEEHDFSRGKTAVVTLSEQPLRVIVPQTFKN